jgi:hypothetical protein
MPDDVVVPAPATPPAPATAPAAATPPAAAPTSATPVQAEPTFLQDRLERERRSVLKQLGLNPEKGIPSQKAIDDAAAALAEGKKGRKAERKAKEAAEAEVAQLKTKVAAIKTFADITMAGLTPEQQAQVKAAAGDDPSEQLKIVALLQPTFTKAASTKETPPVQAAPVPAGTAPPAGPAPTVTGDALPMLEQWKQINALAPDKDGSTNRRELARNLFLLEHGAELIDYGYSKL